MDYKIILKDNSCLAEIKRYGKVSIISDKLLIVQLPKEKVPKIEKLSCVEYIEEAKSLKTQQSIDK